MFGQGLIAQLCFQLRAVTFKGPPRFITQAEKKQAFRVIPFGAHSP